MLKPVLGRWAWYSIALVMAVEYIVLVIHASPFRPLVGVLMILVMSTFMMVLSSYCPPMLRT